MSTEYIAAIFGAVAGGFIFLIAEFIKWYFGREALRKALKIGLYFEIKNNRIVELPLEEGEIPNFSLALYYESFYQQNKTDITGLFDELLLIKLSEFYLMISAANTSQKLFFEKNIEFKEILKDITYPIQRVTVAKKKLLEDQIKDIKNVLRVTLCPALALQEDILFTLKREFDISPGDTKFINVPEKYQAWWEKQNNNP